MDSTKTTYTIFPFEWTIKFTSCQIQYRKAFNINEIDEIFCSIINAKGNEINFSELGILLGFSLEDFAEIDIFKIYLKGLTEYNLIVVNEKEQKIQLTVFGQEAIHSKLKYKYYFATTELFENQTATGEIFDFSFKNVFDIENRLSHGKEFKEQILNNPDLKQKLQLQLFGNDIYKGEIVELYEHEPRISYKTISLECEITAFDNSLELSIFKSGVNIPEVHFLIGLPENAEFKSKLLRRGMYHHIISVKTSISKQDIETYIDLWNWKELAGNPKLDWNDNTIFELFRENGDGAIWSIISEKAPIETIKSVIEKYVDYWNWTTLTERFDDEFITKQIETFDWDFEELSYKKIELVTSLLSNLKIKEKGWDWNYLSKNLPDKFIEEHIEDFPWDFYVITEIKNEVFKNTLFKYRDKLETLISKNWNWRFISEEINLNFLHKNILAFASKLDWHIVLNRFFNNSEIIAKCLKEESFKSLLKQYLPDNFIVAHQKYLWSTHLIDFFETQKLIQWESKTYISGFDTNENLDWSNDIFEKYHSRITTEKGFLNISRNISDYTLVERFPDFAWDWMGISTNKSLLSNSAFIENAFSGKLPYANSLFWNEILLQSNFDVDFWNKHLEAFYNTNDCNRQILFWNLLTKIEEQSFIFQNPHFPWDWNFITNNVSEETILDSFGDDWLIEKWNWEIATRKLENEDILDNLEILARFVDWTYLINEVFQIETELSLHDQLPRIAACLSVLETERRKQIWKDLTAAYPFETLFYYVEKTHQLNEFRWDWDLISNHRYLPTDIGTLDKFRKKINWTILSESKAIQQKFNPDSWNSSREWFGNIDRYLQKFEDNWDWKVLSKNRNINYSRLLLSKYKRENWDWDYLTEFGGFLTKQKKDNDKYLTQIIIQFPRIKFEFLSKRKDINIDVDLILSTKDRNWDWQILSGNEKADISVEILRELKDKNWNWKAISTRKNIVINNETLVELQDKDWDWGYLSENKSLEFNTDFIENLKQKPWNWRTISRHNTFSPTVEILTLTQDFDLDWTYLSQHSNLTPTRELLAKFENKWDWTFITRHPQISFDDIDFIERFANKWDWNFICESGKLTLNDLILNQFKTYLKWDLISINTNIIFTKDIIQQFRNYWNWTALRENKRVRELIGDYVADEINKSPILSFIDKIEQQCSQWKGSIYHFSHIDNAVQIIRDKKIKSRKTANQLSDSAGNVVYSRDDAHSYARFYFRPHTQTQFYNEYLGTDVNMGYKDKSGEWHSWYHREYRLLDFPKCPKPIYFEFSLQEVLFAVFGKCYISTGNMQKNKTKFGKIEQMLDHFNFQDLFINPGMDIEEWKKFREYAQQEFMIENELDFSNLKYFKIICANEEDRTLLITLLGVDSIDIINNLVIDNSYYRNENPTILHTISDDDILILSNKQAEGYFILTSENVSLLEILEGDVIKKENNKIAFKSLLRIKNQLKTKVTIKYIDEIKQEWFIFSNYELAKTDYDEIRIKTAKRIELRIGQMHYNIS